MKFKNLKKKAKNRQSPSISRTLPAFVKIFPEVDSAKLFILYRRVLKVFVVLAFTVTVVIVGYDLQKNLQIKKKIDSQRENVKHDLIYWENFISKHQDYRDAYLQASVLEYRLGEVTKAKMYVKEALSLDPNSIDGKELEKFLANR